MPLPENLDTEDSSSASSTEYTEPQSTESMETQQDPLQGGEPVTFTDFVRRSIRRETMMMQSIEELKNEINALKQGVQNGQGQGGGQSGGQQNGFLQALPVIIEIAKPFLGQLAEMMPMAMAEKDHDEDPLDEMDRRIGREVRMQYERQEAGRRGKSGYSSRQSRYPYRGYLPRDLH